MTSDQIQKFVNLLMAKGAQDQDADLRTLPLWEIAYQLAKQTEVQAEVVKINQELLQLTRDRLDRAEPAKGDAHRERGGWMDRRLHRFGGSAHGFMCIACGKAQRDCVPLEDCPAVIPKAKPGKWRIGTKIPLNVYDGDRPVCQCHSLMDAIDIVTAINLQASVIEERNSAIADRDQALQSLLLAVRLKLKAQGELEEAKRNVDILRLERDRCRDAIERAQGSRVPEPETETGTKPNESL